MLRFFYPDAAVDRSCFLLEDALKAACIGLGWDASDGCRGTKSRFLHVFRGVIKIYLRIGLKPHEAAWGNDFCQTLAKIGIEKPVLGLVFFGGPWIGKKDDHTVQFARVKEGVNVSSIG